MKRLLCILTVCLLTLGFVPSAAAAGTEPCAICARGAAAGDTAQAALPEGSLLDEIDSYIDELLELRAREAGAADLQQLIGVFAKDPGQGEQWYVLIIDQLFPEKYVFYAYCEALEMFAAEQPPTSAASRELIAMTLLAAGSESPFIGATADEAPEQGGLMSLVFGLRLLAAGAGSGAHSADEMALALAEQQKSDGGWAVMGDAGDVDVTAMTLQALAEYLTTREGGAQADTAASDGTGAPDGTGASDGTGVSGGTGATDASGAADTMATVRAATGAGVEFLSRVQKENGGFATLGKYNPESGAQVLCALSQLGIDAANDSRFIKNGRTVFDSFEDFHCAGGGYAHAEGGEENASASRQVLQGLAAYRTRFFGPRDDAPRGLQVQRDKEDPGYTQPRTDPAAEQSAKAGLPVRAVLNISVAALGLIACAILVLLKKRSFKSYAAVLVVCALALVLVNTLRISSPEDYYGKAQAPSGETISTRISIRCDTVAGEKDYIPADGTVLAETEVRVEPGASVYEQLVAACREGGVQLESDGTSGVPYISGIGYIYEMEFGELSGWMFKVNGVFSSVGAGEARLVEGDLVEWIYTRELGRDVGDDYRG